MSRNMGAELCAALLQINADGTWDSAAGRRALAVLTHQARITIRSSGLRLDYYPGLVDELVAEAWVLIDKTGPQTIAEHRSPLGLIHVAMKRSAFRAVTAQHFLTDVSKASHESRLSDTAGGEPPARFSPSDAPYLSTPNTPALGHDPRRAAVTKAVTTLISALVNRGMEHERATRVVGRAWEIMETHSRASNKLHTAAYADNELRRDLARRQIKALIDLMSGPRATPPGTSALARVIEAELRQQPINLEEATVTAPRDLVVLAQYQPQDAHPQAA